MEGGVTTGQVHGLAPVAKAASGGHQFIATTSVEAPADMVWAVFGDFKQFCKWQQLLEFSTPPKFVVEAFRGDSIECTIHPSSRSGSNASLTLRGKVTANEGGSVFSWRGKPWRSSRMLAVDSCLQLEAMSKGSCRVTFRQHWHGLLLAIFSAQCKEAQVWIQELLAALKAHVEAVAAATGAANKEAVSHSAADSTAQPDQ